MAWARRCSACSIDWPNHHDYHKCPHCEEPTWSLKNGNPLAKDEARSIKSHLDFERYYAKRERKRIERERKEAERAAKQARADMQRAADRIASAETLTLPESDEQVESD